MITSQGIKITQAVLQGHNISIYPYINHFETHRSIDAKRVVEVLMELYPELYIEIDDEIEWSGTAQEYLDTEFDY